MEATQNGVQREMPRGGLRPIVYVAMPAMALILGIGIHEAYAACITPAPSHVTATGTGTITEGVANITCTVTETFDVPSPPDNCTPPDPLCVPVTVTFTNCKGTSFGINFSASVSTTTGWQICIGTNGTQQIIPQRGFTATATIGTSHCTTTGAPSGSATISGSFNNSNSTATFSNQSIPVSTSGGFPCPSANSVTFSGSFPTSPAITFN